MDLHDRILATLVVIVALVAILRFNEVTFGGGWPLPETGGKEHA